MSSIFSNAVLVTTCKKRIDALKNHVSAKSEIPVNGETLKASDVIGIYQSVLDTQAALIKSRAQVAADLAARSNMVPNSHVAYVTVEMTVRVLAVSIRSDPQRF